MKTSMIQSEAEALQTKAQALHQTLIKKVIIPTKGEQHIKVKQGYVYELKVKDGEVLSTDFDLIAKKVGINLEVLLGNDTIIIFDNYFGVCATDSSCLVSIPSNEYGMYHVIESDFVVTLADGSQIIHLYGHETATALSVIDSIQSSLFEKSFNDVYLDSNSVGDVNNTPVADSFTDVDVGDVLSYRATLMGGGDLPDWLRFDPTTGKFTGTPPNDDVVTINVTVTANDGNGGVISSNYAITTNNDNNALTVTNLNNDNNTPVVANPIADKFINEDEDFTLTFEPDTFTDVDGDTLTYTATLSNGKDLPAWLSFDVNARTFSGTPLNGDVGRINVTISATDDSGLSATDTFAIVINNVNDAPVVASQIAGQTINEDELFTLAVADSFTDVDVGDTLTLTYTATLSNGDPLPIWLSFDAGTRTFSGTPENDDVGLIDVRVTATDASGGSIHTDFAITINNVNDAPVIANPIADQLINKNNNFDLIVANNFTDVDAFDVLTYSATLSNGDPLPTWLSFDDNAGTFSGIPENNNEGEIDVTVTATDASGASVTDSFAITITNDNNPPTLTNSIDDQSINEDENFTLAVADSFTDVDGDTLTYTATLVDGTALPAWLSFDAGTRTFSGTPENDDVGSIDVRVTATDASGGSIHTDFAITINNVNDAPTVANQIAGQTINEDELFTLAVADSFTDVDVGDTLTLTYTATLSNGDPLPIWLSFDAATGTFSGTPLNDDVGLIDVTVTANDGHGGVIATDFAITINNVNDAPTVANQIAGQTINEDELFTLAVADSFTDVDVGDTLTLTYTATLSNGDPLPIWLSFDAATGTFSGTPLNDDVGLIDVTVTANDGHGGVIATDFAITINNVNDAPVASRIVNQTINEDELFTLPVADSFTDVDVGDTLTYTATLVDGTALPAWLSFDDNAGTFSGTPLNDDVGLIDVTVTANDGHGGVIATDFAITVNNTNDAPVASQIAGHTIYEDEFFTLPVADSFTDVDVGDTLTYTATLVDGTALPAWLSFDDNAGTFSGTPLNDDVGSINVRVTANDASGGSIHTDFAITIRNTNDAPVASQIAGQIINEDELFTLPVADSFTDVDVGDTLTYTATLVDGTALPAWLSFDAGTRTFSGTPENDDVGSIDVRVTATDASGGSIHTDFAITINNVNDAPTVANQIAGQTINEDELFTLAVADSFTDVDVGDTLTLTYTATLSNGDPLPIWLSFDAATGTFSGTPLNDDVGLIDVTVTANDGHGGVIATDFAITINNVNDAPTVANQIAGQTINEDELFTLAVADSFTDVDVGDTLTLTYTATLSNGDPLPIWLSFDAATGTFSGTPLNDDVGLIDVTVTANDGHGGVIATDFAITINNVNDAPTVANQIAGQTINEDELFTLAVADSFTDVDVGDTLTLTYTATLSNGDPLPIWLSFDAATGTFSGTPLNDDVGLIDVTVTANDGHGGVIATDFAITINNVNDAPVASRIVNQTINEDELFTLPVADSFTDVDVGDTLTLTYTATLSNGDPLPIWLSFDAATGTFSGTPLNDDVGLIDVTVTANDGHGGVIATDFAITINNVNDAPTVANQIAGQTINEDELFTLAVADSFTDVDVGDTLTLTYTATLSNGDPLPIWLSFDAATGTFSGTPLNDDVGLIDVTVTANDGHGGVIATDFAITINNVNDAPTVANQIAGQTINEDELFTLAVADSFTDVDVGDTLTLTYTATLSNGDPLPIWLSFDAATGTFSGTPLNDDVGLIDVTVTANDGHGGVIATDFAITINNVNDAPTVANQIAGQTINEDELFTLAVADSFTDVDVGDTLTLTYTATLSNGDPLPIWLSFDAATGTFSGTPLNDDVGLIDVTVTANDGHGGVIATDFAITINNVNDAPTVANQIAGQTINEDELFTLAVADSFTDVDVGDTLTLTYTATLSNGDPLPIWLSFDAATGTFSGTPLNDDVGLIDVTVTANDGHGGVIATDFAITINNVNDAPTVANQIAGQTINEDELFTLAVADSFTDVDVGDTLTLTYTATLSNGDPLPIWLSFDAATGTFSGTPLNDDVGLIDVTVTANDGHGGVIATDFAITINNVNDAPVASRIVNQTINEDELFTLPVADSFTDVDVGDTLTLTYTATLSNGDPLPIWLSFDAATGTFSGTPLNDDVGLIDVTVTANDGHGGVIATDFAITVNNTNDAPVASQIAGHTIYEDEFFTLPVADSFTDVDVGDTLTYTATLVDGTALPAWLSFDDNAGTFSGTPLNDDVGSINVRVTANDASGGSIHTDFAITIRNTNDAPVASQIAGQIINEDELFTLPVADSFTDVDVGDTLTYTATLVDGTALPAWLSFDAGTRTFSGTPENDDVGSIDVRVTANDASGGSIHTDFAITINNVNDAPTVANQIAGQTINEDELFTLAVADSFTDVDVGDTLTLTYTATLSNGDPLPIWLSFDAATGTFSGTPLNDDVGLIDVTVTANDGHGGVIATDFAITINNVNDAPTVANQIAGQTINEDELFTLAVADSFTDVDVGDTLTLTYTATLSNGDPLPIWLSFDAATGTFSGTPLNDDVGLIDVTVTANDGHGGVIATDFAITINNVNDAPTVANQIAGQTINEDELFTLAVADSFTDVDVGDTLTLTYTATLSNGDPLPIWLSFDAATGTFSGTPLNDDVGLIDVTVTANDGHGGVIATDFAITINNVNDAPVASRIVNQTINEDELFTLPVADSFTDVDVGDTLTLTYTATLSNGDPLPIWLSFDAATGTFSGTPLNDDVGLIDVTVTANDGHGGVIATDFAITINNVNDAPTVANQIAGQTINEDELFTLAVADSFTDVDVGDTLTLTYTATLSNGDPLPIWLSFDAATGTFSGTPLNDDVGLIDVTVTANDGHGGVIATDFAITINNVNDAPTVANQIAGQTINEDELFTLAVADSFTDVDVGDTLTLTYTATLSNGDPLPIWLSFDAATGTFSGTPLNDDVGLIDVTVTANDGHGGVIATDFAITINNVNDAPTVANQIAGQTINEDELFTLAVADSFTDVDVGDTLTLTYTATLSNGDPLPIWLSFDAATGTFSGTPLNDDVGLIDVTVTANDGHGGVIATDFAITINNVNDAPTVANQIAGQTINEDELFTLAVADSFTDVDVGDTLTLTYTATLSNGDPLPIWLSFDAATGTFSGTPLNDDVGLIDVTVTANDGHGGVIATDFAITINNVNDAPTVANQIAGQTINEDELFTLAVADSFTDVDVGDTLTLTYTATLSNGDPLPIWLSFDAATGTFSGTPLNDDVGLIDVTVTANDGHGGVIATDFAITINNVNDAPVASRIVNQTINEDELFTLPVADSFTDVDVGDTLTLTYTATLSNGDPLPIWLSFDAATGTFSGTPLNDDVGLIDVTVTANDGHGGVIATDFAITVNNTNDAPVASQIAGHTIYEDEFFTLPVADSFTDVDVGDTLTYTATLVDGTALPAWLSFDDNAGTFSGTPLNDDVGSINVRVTANDASGGSIHTDFAITIRNTNDAPVASQIAGQIINEDELFTLPVADSFTDVDVGDTLTYTATLVDGTALPAWLSFDAGTRTFSGTPENDDVGSIDVRVTANDASGGSIHTDFAIVIRNTNDAPVASQIAGHTIYEDELFTLPVADSFTDVDVGDTLTYTATLVDGTALPAWLSFDDNAGTFSGTPLNDDVGLINVTVTANDGHGGVIATDFAITVNNTNDAPVASQIAGHTINEDEFFTLPVADRFTDVDVGDTLTYTATLVDGTALPAWLSFDDNAGTFSGTPLNDDVGLINVTVTANDGHGGVIATDFAITVNNTNDAPVASQIAGHTIYEDEFFTLPVADRFTDVDVGDTLTYTATLVDGTALPIWLSFDDNAGTFSGTPLNDDVGSINVRVTANDASGGSIHTDFAITINNVNDAPTVANQIAGQIINEDELFTLPVADSFTDVDVGDTLTYTATLVDGTALPAWLSFDDNAGTFSGTPLNDDVGTIYVTVSASDGKDLSVTNFAITVNNTNDAPTVANQIAGQTINEDELFNLSVADSFTDVDGDTLTYSASLVGGNPLPIWLSFDAGTRTFSGTPLNDDVGTINVTVSASDGKDLSVTNFAIVIRNTNDAPILTRFIDNQVIKEDKPFSLTFTPNTFTDEDVSDALSYTATLVDGIALPAWLSFDAGTHTFSGTPLNDDVGTINVKVTANDASGASVSDYFYINVVSVNDAPVVANQIGDQLTKEDEPFSLTFTPNTFTDEEDTTLTYTANLVDGNGVLSALPIWLSFDAGTRTFSGTPLNDDAGVLNVQVSATDSVGLIAIDSFLITVTSVNDAPVVAHEIGDQSTKEDKPFSLTFAPNTFTDEEDTTLTYSATLSNGDPLPTWLSFDAGTRTFSGTPLNDDVGLINVTVTANDGHGGSISTDFHIVIKNVNDAPVASQIASQVAKEDELFTLSVADRFTDVDVGDTLTYTATLLDGTALPTWLRFNSTTGEFTGTPLNDDVPVGNINVRVTATDSGGLIATRTFSLIIHNVNDAPTVANQIAGQIIYEDELFTLPVADSFTDVDVGDTLTYTATLVDGTALPAWLSFDAGTRTFSGTPENDDVGSIDVRVTATDASGGSIHTDFAITVNNTNDAPVASQIAGHTIYEDEFFTLSIADRFTDVDGDTPLTYSASLVGGHGVLSALPAWLSFDYNAGTFSGTPLNDDVGVIDVRVTANDGNRDSIYTDFAITINNVNDAPILVYAISNQYAYEEQSFLLPIPDNFTDVDVGDALTYTATLSNGDPLPTWLSFDAGTRTFSGIPPIGGADVFNVQVSVTDASSASVTNSFLITVSNANDEPIVLANTIANQSTNEDELFTLPVADSFTDTDGGDALTYTATLVDGTALPTWLGFDAATGTFSGTPLNDDVGSINVTVTANDGNGGSISTDFHITIKNTNDAPVLANQIVNQTINEYESFTLSIADSFTDVDVGDVLTYSATTKGGRDISSHEYGPLYWLNFDHNTGTFYGTTPDHYLSAADDTGETIIVTASDGNGGSISTSFVITVVNINEAPVVAHEISDQSTKEDEPFNLTFAPNTFYDVDVGDTPDLIYTATLSNGDPLPTWLSFDAGTHTFSGTPRNNDVGSINVTVTATDGSGLSATDSFAITINNTNDAPIFLYAISNQYAYEEQSFLLSIPDNFTDVDVGDTLTYTASLVDGNGVLSALPAWLRFNPTTGEFTGTPLNDDVGTINVEVTAHDGNGGSISTDFAIVINNVNDAPVVANTIAGQTINEYEPFNLTFAPNTFTDVDVGDTLTYSATLSNGTALPVWLSFDAGTRTFSGTPENSHVGSIDVRVTATDASGGSIHTDFAITINNVNDAPVVASQIAGQTINEDELFTLSVADSFTDVNVGDTLTYSATLSNGTALPVWLRFNPTTGEFTGTPLNNAVGTINVEVTANDGHGGVIATDFAITINNVNDAPVVASQIASQTINEDEPFNLTFAPNTFTDVDVGDTLTYSATLSNGDPLPVWLSFDAGTRTFSGTPLNDDVGTINVRVTATDASGASVSNYFYIYIDVVSVNDAPVVASQIANQTINEDEPFSLTFAPNTFVDKDDAILTYSATLVDGTALPAWLSFDAGMRTFSGTPLNGDVGVIDVRVVARDSGGLQTTDSFAISVANVNDAPTLTRFIGSQFISENKYFSLTFEPDTFTDVDVGDALTYTATLSNGDPLPIWLSFDAGTRTFSGTPLIDDMSNINVAVKASDGGGLSVSQTFAIVPFLMNSNNVNNTPTVDNVISDKVINEDEFFNLSVANTFTDVDGDPLTYSASLVGGNPLPTWLIFDAATGIFSGTPLNDDVGSINVAVKAFDGSDLIATDFAITINNINDAPTLNRFIGNQFINEDENFNLSVANNFTDVDAFDVLTYTATLADGTALPAWLNFDAVTGTFFGIPLIDDVGSINVTISATDASGLSATNSFFISVDKINDAPVVARGIIDQSANENEPFSLTFEPDTFTDEEGDALTYTAALVDSNGVLSALPTWLNFDAGTRTFSGMPPNGNADRLNVRVTAFDGESSAFDEFFIAVNSPTIVDITSTTENGHFKAGDDINISVFVSSDMSPDSTIRVTLSTGLHITYDITLTRDDSDATLYTGTYTVEQDENIDDLNVLNITPVINSPVPTDLIGNALITDLPENHNLADNKDLVIDTIAPDKTTITFAVTPDDNYQIPSSTTPWGYYSPDPHYVNYANDHYVNIAETGIDLEVRVGGNMVAGDEIRLRVGNNLGTLYIVTAADITAGQASIFLSKESLGSEQGEKFITAIVTDAAGNVSVASDAIIIILDTIAPTMTIDTIDGNDIPDTDDGAITVIMSDDDVLIRGKSSLESLESLGLAVGDTFDIMYDIDYHFFAETGPHANHANQEDWTQMTLTYRSKLVGYYVFGLPVDPVFVPDDNSVDANALKIIPLAGMTSIHKVLTLKEWQSIYEHGTVVSFTMRMDSDHGAGGGTINLMADQFLYRPIARGGKARWKFKIRKAIDSDEVRINDIVISNTVYDEYNHYEMVLERHFGEAHLYVNGNLAATVNLVMDPVGTSKSVEWNTGTVRSQVTDRVVYFKDIGINIFTGNTIQATVINANGDWEARIPSVDGLNINGHNLLTIKPRDIAGNHGVTTGQGQILLDKVFDPIVIEFNVDNVDGSYVTGDVIIINAILSETVVKDSKITVILNTLASVELVALADGTTLTGEYTISDGEQSDALTITSFIIDSVIESTLDYEMIATDLPTGRNIDDDQALVINAADTIAPFIHSVDTVLTENVAWINLRNVNIDYDNSLENALDVDHYNLRLKEDPPKQPWYWSSGASSQGEIRGDFSVSVTLLQYTSVNFGETMFGISKHEDVGTHHRDLNYAIKTYVEDNMWMIVLFADPPNAGPDATPKREDITIGADVFERIEVNLGDILTIQKKGEDIIYLVNNQVILKLDGVVSKLDMYHMDTAMKNAYVKISNAVIEYSGETPSNSSTDVVSHTYTFSEKVTGLEKDDFHITNGNIASIEAINPDRNGFSSTWKVNITPDRNVMGDIRLTLKANSVTDRAGMENIDDDITSVVDIDVFFLKDIELFNGTNNYLLLQYNSDIITMSDMVDYEITVNGESRSVMQLVNTGIDPTSMYILYDGETITAIDTYSVKYTVGDDFITNDRGTQASAFEAIIGNQHDANILTGNGNDNFIKGGVLNDTIEGGRGNDTLVGNDGNDIITGGRGNDFIIGGRGYDTLEGGLGRDTFIYYNADAGNDSITNFAMGYDVLNLADLLSFDKGDDLDSLDGFIGFFDDDRNTTISIDVDGLGNFSSVTSVNITLLGYTGGGFDLSSMVDDGSIIFQ